VLVFGRWAWVTYSAQIAQVVGEVVVAPPWELHAFVVPAAKRSRLVARRGRLEKGYDVPWRDPAASEVAQMQQGGEDGVGHQRLSRQGGSEVEGHKASGTNVLSGMAFPLPFG
jgi:hypothetical protein